MAEAAVTVLLENLSHLLRSCADLVSGAEDEIAQLKNEVESLRVFLQEAASKLPKEKEPFAGVARQIQEAVYAAELIIDAHLCRAAAAQGKIDLFRRRRALDTEPASSLAEEVRSLRENKVRPMLEKARTEFADLLQIADGSETIVEEPHQMNQVPSIGQQIIVGFDRDERAIIDHLMEAKKEIEVVSIIGLTGLGKTTLAKKVYQSPQIQYEFPTRIWVYLSQDFNLKDVFLNILKEVTSKDMSGMRDHDLARVVADFLRKRRFLLVLDDVWEYDHFAAIRDALPESNRMGSRVVITTRSPDIGTYANPARSPHVPNFQPIRSTWRLLQFVIFGEIGKYPAELEIIGQQIAKVCQGVPLDVVIFGGILLDQLLNTQSMSALKDKWMDMVQSFTFKTSRAVGKSITMSYNTLPEYMRKLFLYLGVFPEDYRIPAVTLTRLWIAEGFIRHEKGRSLEDIAEENLNRLIRRKLVIVDEMRSNGKVKSCRLHFLVREFCVVKGSYELDLFQEIRYPGEGYYPQDLPRYRRLCIHNNPLDFFSPEPYAPDVRSFLCFSKTETMLYPENTSKIPGDDFKLLRVMDAKLIRFTRFPLQLTQLFCLRYVVLSGDFNILPEVFSMLRNMQTLAIHTSSRILEIKVDIWKMIQLRHLQTNASMILRKEPESHSDQELQTLTNLSPENCTDNVFDGLRCLKKLGIRGILSILLDGEVGSRKIDHLEKLKELENLKLLNDVHMVSPSEGRLPCLPPPNRFPPKLRSLTLSATLLSWEHMFVLGMLENLEVLKLKDNAFVGERWELADGSFPSLQVLQFGYTNLVSWKVSGDHFPKLRSLAIRNCEKLEALPQELKHVVNLGEIELLRPTKAVVVSARKIKEERLQMEEKYSRISLSVLFPPDE